MDTYLHESLITCVFRSFFVLPQLISFKALFYLIHDDFGIPSVHPSDPGNPGRTCIVPPHDSDFAEQRPPLILGERPCRYSNPGTAARCRGSEGGRFGFPVCPRQSLPPHITGTRPPKNGSSGRCIHGATTGILV